MSPSSRIQGVPPFSATIVGDGAAISMSFGLRSRLNRRSLSRSAACLLSVPYQSHQEGPSRPSWFFLFGNRSERHERRGYHDNFSPNA